MVECLQGGIAGQMLSSPALRRGQGGGGSGGGAAEGGRGGGALNGLVHIGPGNPDPEAETQAVDSARRRPSP